MKQIFINLPIKDLDASQAFYRALGFSEHALFTGENQICMKWGGAIYVVLQFFFLFWEQQDKL